MNVPFLDERLIRGRDEFSRYFPPIVVILNNVKGKMQMEETPVAPDWYPDPWRRFEYRYFDGQEWTQHVSRQGQQGSDPVDGGTAQPAASVDALGEVNARAREKVREQAGNVVGHTPGFSPDPGPQSLLTSPVLVVNQKAKLIEVTNEYAIFDQNGNQIGSVRQVGQSSLRKVARVLFSVDQYLTHRLAVCDARGQVLLNLTRPAKFIKSKILVRDAADREIGIVRQENAIGKIRFALESGGRRYGTIQGENWRAWNFGIVDETGMEIARITKTWEGLARTLFTTADNYVVQIHRPLEEPLRSLVVASAVSIDTALKQDARGFG